MQWLRCGNVLQGKEESSLKHRGFAKLAEPLVLGLQHLLDVQLAVQIVVEEPFDVVREVDSTHCLE